MKWLQRSNSKYGYSVAADIAYNLYKYGVKKVRPCVNYTGGYEDIEHINLWTNNICCEPYIKLPEDKDNLLWTILKRFQIGFSGGAGEDGNFMQAGWNKGTGNYEVKNIDPSKLISDICLYHQSFLDFKKNKKE